MQIVTHDDPSDLFKGDPNTIDRCWRTIKVVKVSKGLPNKRLNGYTQAQLLHFPLVWTIGNEALTLGFFNILSKSKGNLFGKEIPCPN